MRCRVTIPMVYAVRADLATLLLQADNMITRFRDVVVTDPGVALALARIVAQIAYRLASERYKLDNDGIMMTIELTVSELRSLAENSWRIIDELETYAKRYEEMINNDECGNKTRCEERVYAIRAFITIIEQLVKCYDRG